MFLEPLGRQRAPWQGSALGLTGGALPASGHEFPHVDHHRPLLHVSTGYLTGRGGEGDMRYYNEILGEGSWRGGRGVCRYQGHGEGAQRGVGLEHELVGQLHREHRLQQRLQLDAAHAVHAQGHQRHCVVESTC